MPLAPASSTNAVLDDPFALPWNLLGHAVALRALEQALASGRFHHAWIFAGPKGVGKFTAALRLACVLLHPAYEPGAPLPDPKSDAHTCGDVMQRVHPDLHIIARELALYSNDSGVRSRKLINLPVDVLRQFMIGGEVGEQYFEPVVSHTPKQSNAKVFIVDEAELIDGIGQNALLKTLEEPPARTIIILVTDRPERLLPTIRSRCQLVRFTPLDPPAMAQWLDAHAPELKGAQRTWVETLADGSPGQAQRALHYGFVHWKQRIEPALAQLDVGRYPFDLASTLIELIEEYATTRVKEDDRRSKDAANKDGATVVLHLLSTIARQRLAEACAAAAPAESWLDAIQMLQEAERQLWSNVNYKHVLENLIVQWSSAMHGGAALVR